MEFARTVTTAVNFPWLGIFILETKTQKNFTHQLVCYLVHENCFTYLTHHARQWKGNWLTNRDKKRGDRLTARLTEHEHCMQLCQGPRSQVRKITAQYISNPQFMNPWCNLYNNNVWNLNCAIKCEKKWFSLVQRVFLEKNCVLQNSNVWRILGLLEQAQKNLWKVFFFGDVETNKNCASCSISSGGLEFFEASFVVQDL